MKKTILLPNLGIMTALASSLCCIMPVLAVLAGTTGIASTFSWVEPARPYFIGLTALILGFAWYEKLTPQKQPSCDCETDDKASFWQSKTFLGVVSILAIGLLTFPSYVQIFFHKPESQTTVSTKSEVYKIEFTINGMTCTGCEQHVKTEISKLKGIIDVKVSYEKRNAIIKFDIKQISIVEINKAINSTGYEATKYIILS